MALRLSQFYLFSFENDDTQLPLFLPKSFLYNTHFVFAGTETERKQVIENVCYLNKNIFR